MKRALLGALLFTGLAQAEEIGCITNTWKLIDVNHKICVDAFSDPRVPGVTCHISQARTGGISGAVGTIAG
jgi:CreA protein